MRATRETLSKLLRAAAMREIDATNLLPRRADPTSRGAAGAPISFANQEFLK